jgi:erythromycin esterase-like protein
MVLLSKPRLERAIGVIYRPETERQSHYFRAFMRQQFDAVFHFDDTRALEPLEKPERWHEIEPPETYPFGI